MYAIIGITGNVGGSAAIALRNQGQQVRGIVRDKQKASGFLQQGVELVSGDVNDVESLVRGLKGCEGAFIMLPPIFAPEPGFPEAVKAIASLRKALSEAKPEKIAYLSSIGAQHSRGTGLIFQSHLLEEAMKTLPTSNAFVRGAWFLENYQWDVQSAVDRGSIDSYLDPISKPFPMVSTQDIGELVARVLIEKWNGKRILEIEAPQRYSALDAAEAFSNILNRKVTVNPVPRREWQKAFVAQGMPPERTGPRMEMVDGFNSGWIEFEKVNCEAVKGRTTIEEALRKLVSRQAGN
jgi:NAD(P)H dehydrogenase (quinone)